MKPYKMFGPAMIILALCGVIYNGKFNLENTTISLIYDAVFSFVFPAVIFFTSWLASLRVKENNKSIFSYYTKVLLNIVLPYFLCMIPYIIYYYGLNNLGVTTVLNLYINGDIAIPFLYFKTYMHLALVLPIAEYFVKLNPKVTCIVSFALTLIFNLFHLNTYIYTDLFNYLIYMVLGVAFTYNDLEASYYFKKSKNDLSTKLLFMVILLFVTNLEQFRLLNPIPKTIYNILIIVNMVHKFYSIRIPYKKEEKYAYQYVIFRKPIIIVSALLLFEIILTVFIPIFEDIVANHPIIHLSILAAYFIFMLYVIDFCNAKVERDAEKRRDKLFRRR